MLVAGEDVTDAIRTPEASEAASRVATNQKVRGASELRFKELNRIAAVVEGLSGLGADIEETDDGFVVRGDGSPLRGGTIASRGDHRLAMLGAVAGLASTNGVEVVGMDATAVSYPAFERDLEALLRG